MPICVLAPYEFSKIGENKILITSFLNNPSCRVIDYEHNTLFARNHAYVEDFVPDNDGGYFQLSRTHFSGWNGNYDLPQKYDEYLIKYDENLDSLWAINIDAYLENGVEYQDFQSMTATSDGGYAFCGEAGNDLFKTIFIIKADEYGNYLWVHGYDVNPHYPFRMVRGLFETDDGGFVMFAGNAYSGSQDSLYLIKTNSDGTINTKNYFEDDFTLSVFPNPCTDILNISFNENFTGIIKITNITGQIMINKNISNKNSETIDISDFPTGIYLCNIYNEEGNIIQNKKIIKQ